jgi:hydrogenase assembly chaperone HypC/HupF
MCLAIPGRIVSISGSNALVAYGSEKREAKVIEGSYAVGDYVIVQGKIIIEKIPEEELKEWMDLY